MGYTYRAYALIGVKINVDKITNESRERSCNCDVIYDEKNPPKFCSDCGQEFKEKRRIFTKQVEGGEAEELFFLGKYPMVFPVLEEEYEDQKEVYIALLKRECNDDSHGEQNGGELPTAEQIEKFKNDLSIFEWWDEKKFKLWSVLI